MGVLSFVLGCGLQDGKMKERRSMKSVMAVSMLMVADAMWPHTAELGVDRDTGLVSDG